jgi:DNA invertase Pin-like site-specific DNA recombinase
VVVVHSMDRLARNLDDLRKIVKDLTSRDVSIKFIKENLTFDNQVSPMSNLLLSVMGAFAEFERSLIKERQREGIELAKKRGVYKGRRSSLSEDQIQTIIDRLDSGEAKTSIAKSLGISRETLYQHLRKRDELLDNPQKESA